MSWSRRARRAMSRSALRRVGAALARQRRIRTCRRLVGHCWHPADAMILWRCCACPADRDGIPEQHGCVWCQLLDPCHAEQHAEAMWRN